MSRPSVRPQPVPYPAPQTSRSSYPTFLSFQQTATLQATWALKGLFEASRWDVVFRTATSDPEIRANVFKSLLLNLLSLTSIYTFDLLLQPLVRDHPSWLHRNVGWFYRVLWLLPVVGVSFYLNSTWCNLIAKRTFVLQHGSRAAQQQPTTYTGMLTMLATSAYRAVMVLTSIIVSFALRSIPYAGPATSFAFMCWVDAYYCFEFIWVARGLSLSRRVRHLEERWAYYFAFGLPSAAICTWGSGLANAALFALMFPAFIIMAMHAKPVPQDPFNPVPNTAVESSDVVRYPSPYIPIRMPVFAAVIWLNDRIVRILSVGGSGAVQRRHRAHSDSSEQAEEGAGIEMRAVGVDARMGIPRRPGGRVQGAGRVFTSPTSRRKAD
ncbi:EI24-domain-containing protein [Leucogyrophana mollusca]|uniref:EI24-domain-containing protein n=1 Tax=Leucogyrophana mollusca TaxID=85980 RepID=A0ACB8BBJ0_9AGAM|nr:EI24-domain-containing protein [Leucogyrophana mollusca]